MSGAPAAGFGLDALDADQCEEIFAALRQVRLAARDFTVDSGE